MDQIDYTGLSHQLIPAVTDHLGKFRVDIFKHGIFDEKNPDKRPLYRIPEYFIGLRPVDCRRHYLPSDPDGICLGRRPYPLLSLDKAHQTPE